MDDRLIFFKIQNPQLVTSYALPPQTSFAIAPYSLYRKGSSKSPSFRFTYAAVTQAASSEKPQILCFIEEVKKDGTSDTTKSSYALPDAADKIVSIDSVPLGSGNIAKHASHDVLIALESGHILCLSSNLDVLRWEADLRTLLLQDKQASNGSFRIEHVTLTTAKAAISGLLRNRQDIAAILDPALKGTSEILNLTSILCIIFRHSNRQRSLALFHIQPRLLDYITTHSIPLKQLLTWKLPLPTLNPISESAERLYHLHSSTGALHQLSEGRMLSYDFSETIPKIYSDFSFPGSTVNSFLRISSDVVFTASKQSWGVFNVKYSSIQALLSLEQSSTLMNESKKRKHLDQQLTKSSDCVPTLVSYSTEIGLAVGILKQEIIGVQIANAVSPKRAKTNSTLLIDSIGRGTMHPANIDAYFPKDSPQWLEWQKRVRKLDKHVSKGNVTEFEQISAKVLDIDLAEANQESQTNSSKSNAMLENRTEVPLLTNGLKKTLVVARNASLVKTPEDVSDDGLRKWQLPRVLTDSKRHRYRHFAIYALKKIFRLTRSEDSSKTGRRKSILTIEFFPPNVFQWLLLSGYLTKESIRRAILEDHPDNLGMVSSISDGDIIKAVVEFDPELHLLSAILNHGHFLPVGEVVEAIRVLMQSLDDQPREDKISGLLTDGTVPSDDEMDIELASELDAATNDLDHVLSILDNGLLIRNHTLRPALMRLHTFPAAIITSALRSMLPRRDLESLIRLLHSELRNGGWTLPYNSVDRGMAMVECSSEHPDDHAVAIIAQLLSCALDAIGAGAWLSSVGDSAVEETSEDIIHQLLEDTSEAVNGFWEARFMRGLLSEFLRYASNLAKTQKPANEDLQKQRKPFAPDVATVEALSMLPLGGKVDLGVEKTKAGKGGRREERSAREIGMLISKRVPKYSLERIVI